MYLYHTSSSGTVDPEIYPEKDGSTVFVCGEQDYTELPDDPQEIQPDISKCNNLITQAGYASTRLSNAEVLVAQAAYLPGSPDNLPIIGKVPGSQNVYIATGHFDWGILNGPATGKCLAELILYGETKTCDISPLRPDRFLKN